MKTKLFNPTKITVPYDALIGDKELDPLSKLGLYLKKELNTEHQINVSSIWINKNTEEKLDNIFFEYFSKIKKLTKSNSKKAISIYKLMSGPALDFNDTFGLEDDYIYVEEDFYKQFT